MPKARLRARTSGDYTVAGMVHLRTPDNDTRSFTQSQAIAIMNTPVNGDATIILAHHPGPRHDTVPVWNVGGRGRPLGRPFLVNRPTAITAVACQRCPAALG